MIKLKNRLIMVNETASFKKYEMEGFKQLLSTAF